MPAGEGEWASCLQAGWWLSWRLRRPTPVPLQERGMGRSFLRAWGGE